MKGDTGSLDHSSPVGASLFSDLFRSRLLTRVQVMGKPVWDADDFQARRCLATDVLQYSNSSHSKNISDSKITGNSNNHSNSDKKITIIRMSRTPIVVSILFSIIPILSPKP